MDRAKFHLDILRSEIRAAGQGEPYTIPLRKEFDEETGTLYLRVDRITSRPEEWGPLIGDALHNFRSAVDHGWWQLAAKHLRHTPTEEEAKHIQFPILRPGGNWDPGNHRQWVGKDATAYAGTLQPDKRGYPADVIHPLVALNRFSNIDKHRNVHLTVERLHTLQFTVRNGDHSIDSAPLGTFHHFTDAPKAGDPVLTAPPDSLLHEPGVEFNAHQSGFVAIEGKWDLLMVMAAIDQWVGFILAGFQSLLDGKAPATPKISVTPKT